MRTCGSCQLCCKLLPMPGDNLKSLRALTTMIETGFAKAADFRDMSMEIKKPAGERCLHQRHGKGCAIYARRPFSCRVWSCRWLVEDDTEGLHRPDHAHYVIDMVPDYVTVRNNETGELTQIDVVQIWIDPRFPDAHREPALRAYMQRRAEQENMATIIRFSETEAVTVFPPALATDGEWHEITGQSEVRHRE